MIDGGHGDAAATNEAAQPRWGQTWSKPMCCKLRLEDKGNNDESDTRAQSDRGSREEG